MDASTTASAYRTQQIMTASPEELTLMLYNGAIRFVSESIQSLEAGNLEKSHNANIRAQNIVREFMATLDLRYDIAKNLLALYDYIEHCLIQGNTHKDKSQLEQARSMLQELRDAWIEAMKQVKLAKVVGR